MEPSPDRLPTVDEMTDILDIEGIARFPWEKLIGTILAVLAALLLLYLGWRLFRWWKSRRGRLGNLKPHERAFRDLERLSAQNLAQRGEFKSYYSELDGIFRGYLSARYPINAADRTPAEILEPMRRELKLSEPLLQDAADFFRNAELAKFAEQAGSPEDALKDAQRVRSWVERTLEAAAPKGGA